jgi:hypothetical protein
MKQRNAQHLIEQNTDKNSLMLENEQACDPALVNDKGETTVHCGCLLEYPQQPRHILTDAAVHDKTCQGLH